LDDLNVVEGSFGANVDEVAGGALYDNPHVGRVMEFDPKTQDWVARWHGALGNDGRGAGEGYGEMVEVSSVRMGGYRGNRNSDDSFER